LASKMVAGRSWRMVLPPDFYDAVPVAAAAFDDPRGQVRYRRGGLRCLLLVMSALTRASRPRDARPMERQGLPEVR